MYVLLKTICEVVCPTGIHCVHASYCQTEPNQSLTDGQRFPRPLLTPLVQALRESDLASPGMDFPEIARDGPDRFAGPALRVVVRSVGLHGVRSAGKA